jgi:hypothetical protein
LAAAAVASGSIAAAAAGSHREAAAARSGAVSAAAGGDALVELEYKGWRDMPHQRSWRHCYLQGPCRQGLLLHLVHHQAGCWCGAPPQQHCHAQQGPYLQMVSQGLLLLLACLVVQAAPSWPGRVEVEPAGQEQCSLHHRCLSP